ncbi:MAG TPA: DNA ligase [Candidatus Udaeobacter sp.]|jgi:DNA ligase-1
MKLSSRCRAPLLALAAGIFLACSVAAKEKDLTAASPTAERQAPPLLLANVWSQSVDPTGWWMSEKYDGLRGYWDGRNLWSRKGNLIHAPDYFLAELPRDIALDGELWIGYGKFEDTISIVRSDTPDDGWKRVRFMVFDAPQAKGTFEERMQFLRVTLPEGNRFVTVVAQKRCEGAAQLLAERDRVVRLGGEGLMLRQPGSAYEGGRSSTLLKVKPYDDAEATVIAHEPGQGKFAGKLGALRVRTDDGREFSIGSGFTDAQRESPPPVGTVITYRFRGLTAKGLPRFPSYLRVRQDY